MKFTANQFRNGTVRAFVDGREVTTDCLAFDADEGWVECRDRLPDGTRRIVNGRALSVRFFGKVTTDPPVQELPRLARRFVLPSKIERSNCP